MSDKFKLHMTSMHRADVTSTQSTFQLTVNIIYEFIFSIHLSFDGVDHVQCAMCMGLGDDILGRHNLLRFGVFECSRFVLRLKRRHTFACRRY